MAQAALKFTDELAILPPSFDLLKAMSLVRKVEDFEKVVRRGEIDTLAWRSSAVAKAREAREIVRRAEQQTSYELVAEAIAPHLIHLKAQLDLALKGLETPLAERPDLKIVMGKLATVPPPLRRYMRKQLERADNVRLNYLEGYYALRDIYLTLEWDYDPDARGGPAFSNADDLLAHLHA